MLLTSGSTSPKTNLAGFLICPEYPKKLTLVLSTALARGGGDVLSIERSAACAEVVFTSARAQIGELALVCPTSVS